MNCCVWPKGECICARIRGGHTNLGLGMKMKDGGSRGEENERGNKGGKGYRVSQFITCIFIVSTLQ